MIKDNALLTYARNESGAIVHVDEVPNGKGCSCVCPNCNRPLIAKNGGLIREHHFAHYDGENCVGARMTALHEMAQQIIKEQKRVMLPDYKRYIRKELRLVEFDDVELEKRVAVRNTYLKPDCIGVVRGKNGENRELWIEIRVNHKVDSKKLELIRELNVACIEIDLTVMLYMEYTKESVTRRLLNKEYDHDRKWINCPKYDEENRILEYEFIFNGQLKSYMPRLVNNQLLKTSRTG